MDQISSPGARKPRPYLGQRVFCSMSRVRRFHLPHREVRLLEDLQAEELKALQDAHTLMDKYKQQECIIKQQIYATIPNTLLLKVQSKVTTVDVWNTVQNEMKNKSEMYRVDMRQRDGRVEVRRGWKSEKHIEMLVLMNEEYTTIGGVLTDAEFHSIILSSVPPTYKEFLRSVMTSASLSNTDITSKHLCSVILEYYREKSRDTAEATTQQTMTTSPNVTLAANASGSGDRKFSGQCHNCKKKGHKRQDCRKLGGGAYKGDSMQGKEGQGASDSKANIATAVLSDNDHTLAMFVLTVEAASIARTGTTDPCAGHEIYDRGATCHMLPYWEYFIDMEELDVPVTIATVDGRALSAVVCGTVVVCAPNGDSTTRLCLRNALFVHGWDMCCS